MKKNNRDTILETARRLFPKYGYNGISIREIAREAGLTTGAIYFHFKNKRDIYRTICFEAIDLLLKSFRENMKAGETPGRQLISIFDSYISFYYEHNDYYNILMEYKSAYESDRETSDNEIADKFIDILRVSENTIRQGTEQGFYRDINPMMLSIFLAAVTEGLLQYKKLGLFDVMKLEDRSFRNFMATTVGQGILGQGSF